MQGGFNLVQARKSQTVTRQGPSRPRTKSLGRIAWFLMNRIRDGFTSGLDKPVPEPVEADET